MLETLLAWCTSTGIKLVVSIVLLIIAFKVIDKVASKLAKSKKLIELDETLVKALLSAAKALLKILVVIALIGYLGIDTSGLAAVVASLGVCIGLAVNGALSNLAGGILLLITRPFKVGDYIKCADAEGTVEDIRIISTKIVTNDNKVVYLPNSTASSSTVVNFSEKELRRVDLNFQIAYENDYETAKAVISAIAGAHELILKDPAPMVRVSGHGESSIQLVSRCWVKSADYWTVYFDLLEAVKAGFELNGITIPYPQLDVHMKTDAEKKD